MDILTLAFTMPALALLGVVGSFSSALNGLVGRRLGTLPATLVFLGVGALACVPLILLFESDGIGALAGLPWYLYVPGLINVFLISNLIYVVNRIGTVLTLSAMFSGQVVLSNVLDHIGFLGLPTIPITLLRASAVFVLIAGILIAVSPPRRDTPRTSQPSALRQPALWMAFLQGAVLAVVTALNAVVGIEAGPFMSTFLFLAPGSVALLVWFWRVRPPVSFTQVRPAFLLPGSLNVVGIAGGVLLVPIVGLQFTTAARVTASLITGLYIDRQGMFGLPRQAISRQRIVGTVILTLGVIMTIFG